MSEAFLLGNNGIRFKRLRVPVPPEKTAYLYHDGAVHGGIDMTGAKVVADIGKSEVVLASESYSVEMVVLTETTAQIVVEATIGGTTKHATIPITLLVPDSVLDNNTWNVISLVSEAGLAEDLWDLGDIKTVTIGGVDKRFRIIGFDHDVLSSSDAEYGTSYNGGSGHAGITFQAMEANNGKMNLRVNNRVSTIGGWDNSYMRNTAIPAVLSTYPTDLQAVLRTVDKVASPGNEYDSPGDSTASAKVITSQDKLFLLNMKEINGSSYHIGRKEAELTSQYALFTESDTAQQTANGQWTRSPDDPGVGHSGNLSYFIFVLANSRTTPSGGQDRISFESPDESKDFYPAFCV